jgi:hypothetical protein
LTLIFNGEYLALTLDKLDYDNFHGFVESQAPLPEQSSVRPGDRIDRLAGNSDGWGN